MTRLQDIPTQFKLTVTNITLRIFVADGTKLDVGWVFHVSESKLGGAVKDVCHLLNYVWCAETTAG